MFGVLVRIGTAVYPLFDDDLGLRGVFGQFARFFFLRVDVPEVVQVEQYCVDALPERLVDIVDGGELTVAFVFHEAR